MKDSLLFQFDLHLLSQALESKHYRIWEECFKQALSAYEKEEKQGKEIVARLKQVEERVLEFLKELLQNVWQNDVIFICASGNSLRPIRRYFEKMTEVQMASFEHEPAKIYTYEV